MGEIEGTTRRAGRARRGLLAMAVTASALLVSACVPPTPPPAPVGATYRVDVAGETFTLRATNPTVIAQLDAALASGRVGVLGGELLRGNGGFNAPHQWHIDPATVYVADLAMEVCDGRPFSEVGSDIDYWVDVLGTYCPWGARVTARL
jgi:hypothetical protein